DIRQDEADDYGGDYGPTEAVLGQEGSNMAGAPLKVGAGGEYLFAHERMVGGYLHEGYALRVGRAGYLLCTRAPLRLHKQEHFGAELPGHHGVRDVALLSYFGGCRHIRKRVAMREEAHATTLAL